MKKTGILKRIICVTMIAAMLALTTAPALAKSSKPSGAYVVTTVNKNDRLRVHSTPGGSVVAKLKRGTVVSYKSSKNGWWYVSYRGGKGYVDRTCLTSVTKLSSAKYTPVDNLWVRSEPKTGATKLGKLGAGKKVTINKQKGTWVRINYKGHNGWVPAIYLKRV